MCVQLSQLSRILVRAFLVALLIAAPIEIGRAPVRAQDAGELATPAGDSTESAVDVSTDSDSTTDAPPETELDSSEGTSTDESDQGASADESTTSPSDEASPESGADNSVTPSPSLTYEPTAPPSCLPVSGDVAEPIAAGGTLDYDCTSSLSLAGAWLDPATIALDWSISIWADSGWTAQLSADAGVTWTDPEAASATLDLPLAYGGDGSGVVESWQDMATVQFGLRVHRPACSTDPGAIDLQVTGSAALPGDDATITTTTQQPLGASLAPDLTPLDTTLPVVSIAGVSIDPVAFSLEATQTHGRLTIQVDNPVPQCRQSNVLVSLQPSGDAEIDQQTTLSAVGALDASTIAAAVADPSGEGGSLSDFVIVSSVPVGAEAGSYQQTIDFELTIPAAAGAGAYQLAASVMVDPAE